MESSRSLLPLISGDMETILLNYSKQLILYMSEEEKFLINMFDIKSDLEYASITFMAVLKHLKNIKNI